MRRDRRFALAATAALLLAPLPAIAASGAPLPAMQAQRVQPWLAGQLATASASQPMRVMVRGTSAQAAAAAAKRSGLRLQQVWDQVGIVVAVGLPAQVRTVVRQPGVRYVDGDMPLSYTLDTAHKATRSDVAMATRRTATGGLVDGTGVTVAIIDSGIDSLHPFFAQGGVSKVVQNRKNVCGIDLEIDPLVSEACFAPVLDPDTASVGGHGTHVAGIVGGVVTKTTGSSPKTLRGAAPGAKLVGLSVGAAIGLVDAAAAQNWVLQHQKRPCRAATDQKGPVESACPPIRVTNHSYGPTAGSNGNRFNANSADVILQRALVAKGVVAVWAAGNDGGSGSKALTNPPGMDETPGILMVASYNDAQNGARDNKLSSFSSRGQDGDPTTYPDISAPGDKILSSCRPYLAVCSSGLAPVNGPGPADVATFNSISGTSMASPYIAGVVAVLFQANPKLTPADIERVIEDSAHRFTAGADYERDDPERNTRTLTSYDKGHGLVDVQAAIGLALKKR